MSVTYASAGRCTWSEWSSCDFLCGQSRVRRKRRKVMKDSFEQSNTMCVGTEEEECYQSCLGKISNLIFTWTCSEPHIFGNWTSTGFCNGTCGTASYQIVRRSCTPTHPEVEVSCNQLREDKTLRTGQTTCQKKMRPCIGQNNCVCLNYWYYIDVFKEWSQWSSCEDDCEKDQVLGNKRRNRTLKDGTEPQLQEAPCKLLENACPLGEQLIKDKF